MEKIAYKRAPEFVRGRREKHTGLWKRK